MWPSVSAWGRLLSIGSRLPLTLILIGGAVLLVVIGAALNWTYQVVRKPSELFFPISDTLYKSPSATWRSYGPAFRRHATRAITPEFLAALAQVEASGNPVARTYWRWSWRPQPFEMYRPASSAVGMYQITDGTFDEARRYCIHENRVVEVGAWDDWDSCWFNSLYTRVIPSHAIELTSAYLDRQVTRILLRNRISSASTQQKQDLATVIHLCGAGAGNRFARHGLRVTAGQRCGDHGVGAYLAKVTAMKWVFARLASADVRRSN